MQIAKLFKVNLISILFMLRMKWKTLYYYDEGNYNAIFDIDLIMRYIILQMTWPTCSEVLLNISHIRIIPIDLCLSKSWHDTSKSKQPPGGHHGSPQSHKGPRTNRCKGYKRYFGFDEWWGCVFIKILLNYTERDLQEAYKVIMIHLSPPRGCYVSKWLGKHGRFTRKALK